MAPSDYNYEYFNVTFPAEYVAHVEVKREEKLNAFIEVYVHTSVLSLSRSLNCITPFLYALDSSFIFSMFSVSVNFNCPPILLQNLPYGTEYLNLFLFRIGFVEPGAD